MPSRKQHPSCAMISLHIGKILLVHRTRLGFTQAYVAEQVGLKTASSINRFESGKSNPSLDVLIRLTIFLGINPNLYFQGLVMASPQDPEKSEPPLSLEELKELVEPFKDPAIRSVVINNMHQIDDPDAIAFVETLTSQSEPLET